MNLALFSALFIIQFVGHRIGDYLIQGNTDSMRKGKSFKHRLRHCLMYSTAIGLLVLTVVAPLYALIIWAVTLIEHLIVDSRKPVVGWKNFFERKIMRDKYFDTDNLPFFVLIEIDQTFHIVRIFIISLVLAYIL